jgi:enediyne biosynthesis protein E4
MSQALLKKIGIPLIVVATTLAVATVVPTPAQADGGVTFRDIVLDGSSGISYSRAASPTKAFILEARTRIVLNSEQANFPATPDGTPGVVIFDYDNDSDEDILVTQGPGVANNLYQNQWCQTGALEFVDVGAAAGLSTPGMDVTGACAGDVDNDGDMDVLMVGSSATPRFFRNDGRGAFQDESAAAGFTGAPTSATGCSFGDFNNDGFLDVTVANSWNDWTHQRQSQDPYLYNEHEQVFLNDEGAAFVDVSDTSGIKNLAKMPAFAAGKAGLTWATAAVDIDQDGDTDIINGDDQNVPWPPAALGGADLGLLRLFRNDGAANFVDSSDTNGLNRAGAWMGMTFGDWNCDGLMDIFGTNGGDYYTTLFGFPRGTAPSTWFLQQSNGTFTDPGVGSLVATPFGWGAATFDYDNDGDQDIIFHGGLENPFLVTTDNPGALLQNVGCNGVFQRDAVALAGSADHKNRTVYGVAVGDLNNDGFLDIVSAASQVVPASAPHFPYTPYGSPFDAEASRVRVFVPNGVPNQRVWSGVAVEPGDLSVEINSGGNGNNSASLRLLGTIGLVRGRHANGAVNRNAVGAVATFTPQGGRPSVWPVLAGASYGSQNTLTTHVGLGEAPEGTLEIVWPGGVRNRLYEVKAGETLLVPEIPCSYTSDVRRNEYRRCVREAVQDLRRGRNPVLTREQARRIQDSAERAFEEHRGE